MHAAGPEMCPAFPLCTAQLLPRALQGFPLSISAKRIFFLACGGFQGQMLMAQLDGAITPTCMGCKTLEANQMFSGLMPETPQSTIIV